MVTDCETEKPRTSILRFSLKLAVYPSVAENRPTAAASKYEYRSFKWSNSQLTDLKCVYKTRSPVHHTRHTGVKRVSLLVFFVVGVCILRHPLWFSPRPPSIHLHAEGVSCVPYMDQQPGLPRVACAAVVTHIPPVLLCPVKKEQFFYVCRVYEIKKVTPGSTSTVFFLVVPDS